MSKMSTGIPEQKDMIRWVPKPLMEIGRRDRINHSLETLRLLLLEGTRNEVPKPLMEKRRRDRINHSLETLRLLLLESTRNEKLKNPKVEKAEILESVVNFLRAEQRSGSHPNRGKRGRTEYEEDEVDSPCKRRQIYQDGMRTCLLRVSHFIASKDQELDDGLKNMCGTLQQNTEDHHSIQNLVSASHHHHGSLMHLSYESSSTPGQQSLTHLEPATHCTALSQPKLPQRTAIYEPAIKMAPNSKQPSLVSDSVWRPWPQ